jgi:N6-adenosine-specific RNA methylase IME4
MPAVSFYLKKDVLDAVRSRAGARSIPVSRLISRAVEEYLKTEEMLAARRRVLERFRREAAAPGWESIHQERTRNDADRD